jgi:hypothetical protein
MSDHQRSGQQRKWLKVLLTIMVAAVLGPAARAQALYPRAAWVANIRFGEHSVQAFVTIVDDHTLQVEHFTYDGTAPLVYFYLGASNSSPDFENGLQLEPLLDRPYNDESLTLTLPVGETLDGYNAIAVWCAEFMVNFGSASFMAPATMYERAGWVADIPLGLHLVEGQATIINDRIINVQHFSYDGTAPLVYFYLGATDNNDDFQNGLQIPPLLDRAYVDESLVLLLPEGTTLDGYEAIAVWCEQFSVNFGSASFINPLAAAGDEPVGPTRFALHANTPNPFNPATTVAFDLPSSEQVKLAVYDLTGRRVRLLLDQQMPAGRHRVRWSGRDDRGSRVASGMYLCCIQAGSFTATKRMMLVK